VTKGLNVGGESCVLELDPVMVIVYKLTLGETVTVVLDVFELVIVRDDVALVVGVNVLIIVPDTVDDILGLPVIFNE